MKLAPFQRILREHHIDLAFLVHPDPNLIYGVQMKPSYGYFLITPAQATLYLTKLDAFPRLRGVQVKPFAKNWEKNYRKIKKIGINKQTLTVAQAEKIQKKWPKAKLVDIASHLIELRVQKIPEEIRKIQKACTITIKAFQDLLQELPAKRLKTEQEVAFFLEKSMRQQGAEIAFPTIAASGKNAAVPHHVPTAEPLQRGFLVLDFGAQYQHYCADMSRTIFLGTPTKKEKMFYELVLRAQQASITAVKEGIPFTTLEAVARKQLGKYSSKFIHSLGHGIGIEVHEAPVFSDTKWKIQRNMVFTIEPGIYVPGKFGIRIEDTLLFDGKVKILTDCTKELIRVPELKL